jgi:hypothetical protein
MVIPPVDQGFHFQPQVSALEKKSPETVPELPRPFGGTAAAEYVRQNALSAQFNFL